MPNVKLCSILYGEVQKVQLQVWRSLACNNVGKIIVLLVQDQNQPTRAKSDGSVSSSGMTAESSRRNLWTDFGFSSLEDHDQKVTPDVEEEVPSGMDSTNNRFPVSSPGHMGGGPGGPRFHAGPPSGLGGMWNMLLEAASTGQAEQHKPGFDPISSMPAGPGGPVGPGGPGGSGGMMNRSTHNPLSMSNEKLYPPGQSMVFNPQNPLAPPVYPCGNCRKEVHDNDQAILCESGCNFWFHRPCTGLLEPAFHYLTQEVYAEWVCDTCIKTKDVPLVKFKP